MKKMVLAAVVAALVGGAAFAHNQTIGTNSVTLMVRKPIKRGDYTTWASGVSYTQGQIVKNGINYYMAVAAGTSSTTAPVHTRATDADGEASDGGVTWRWISSSRRSGAWVAMRSSTGKADLELSSYAAIATNGIPLKNEAHTLIFSLPDNYQGALSAISTDTNDVVLTFGEF